MNLAALRPLGLRCRRGETRYSEQMLKHLAWQPGQH
jgi:hypothetical protein